MDSKNELINLLEKVKNLLFEHDNISWDGLSPAEVGMDLEICQDKIRNREGIDKEYLKALFSPAGPIQECAKANNWTDEYLQLSTMFDLLINKIK